jgi:hypothetical protein
VIQPARCGGSSTETIDTSFGQALDGEAAATPCGVRPILSGLGRGAAFGPPLFVR